MFSLIIVAALCGQQYDRNGGGTFGSGYYSDLRARQHISQMSQDAYYGSLQWQSDQYWLRVQQQQAYQRSLLYGSAGPYVLMPDGSRLYNVSPSAWPYPYGR